MQLQAITKREGSDSLGLSLQEMSVGWRQRTGKGFGGAFGGLKSCLDQTIEDSQQEERFQCFRVAYQIPKGKNSSSISECQHLFKL